jgi:hypothetical protein
MFQFFRALIALSILGTSLFGEDPDARVYSAKNEHFEIISDDPISLTWMAHLSKVVAADIIHLTGFDAPAIRRKIIVELIPSESNHSLPYYRISLDPRGYYRLRMKWSEQLSIEVAIQAVCEVFLQRYRYNTLGLRQSSQCSRWLQTAVHQWVYLRRFPAERLRFKKSLQNITNDSLEKSLMASQQRSDLSRSSWECLALLELMRNSSRSKQAFQKRLIDYAGTRPLKPLLETIFPELSKQTLDDWWQAKRTEVTISAFHLCESIEESRSWLSELAAFQTLVDSTDTSIPLKQLWYEREIVQRQKQVRARSVILQQRLQMINPAYFNTARALQALFLSVLTKKTKIEFTHHLLEFQSLLDDADEMQNKIHLRMGRLKND